GNVRPTLEQRRRQTRRHYRSGEGDRRSSDRELGGRLADEYRDGVLEGGALDSDIDRLRARRFELGPGRGDVGLAGNALAIAALGNRQGALKRRDGGIEQALQLVGDAQLKIVDGQRSLGGELGSGEIRRARLGVCHI